MSDADTPEPDMSEIGGSDGIGGSGGGDQAAAALPDAGEEHPQAGVNLTEKASKNGRGGAFMGVPIEVTISVGKARPLVSELVELRRDSVLPLNSSIDDPVELYIGDRLIARGELQEIGESGGRLGVRLTEVADISNEI